MYLTASINSRLSFLFSRAVVTLTSAPSSPGKYVAYEACRLLHKLGFVVRALDIDSLEDRRLLGNNKKQQPQSSLKQRSSKNVSADSPPPVQEVSENETQDTLIPKPLENMPQSSPDYESQNHAHHGATMQESTIQHNQEPQNDSKEIHEHEAQNSRLEELSPVESQAPPATQEASSHEFEPPFAYIEDPFKKEPKAITHSIQEHPELKDQVRPVDRPPVHTPRPEKEFFELVMWADAQIWCFPEKTNDLLSICNRHFKEETSPVLQGQPVPIIYFNDTPSPVYQSHAIRHTIGKHRKLVPIPARTDLQGIRAHFSERMTESGIRTRFVDAVEDLAKYTLLLCRKKHDSIFKYKYSTEKAKAKKHAAKSAALAGVAEGMDGNEKPQDAKKIVEKKEAFTRLLNIPKEKVIISPRTKNDAVSKSFQSEEVSQAKKIVEKNEAFVRLLDIPEEKVIRSPRKKEDPVSKSVQTSDEVSQEAKLLRLKRLLGIEVARDQAAETTSGEEDESSKDIQSTEDSQVTDEVRLQTPPAGEAGGAGDSQVQEDTHTPVDPQATEKTML